MTTICGEGAVDHTPDGDKPFGCGLPIDGGMREYRCTDCDLAFHKACAKMHFAGATVPGGRPSCSEADRLRDVIARVLEWCKRHGEATYRIEVMILAADVDLRTAVQRRSEGS